jgi:CheY-like chemotaxis protein
MSKAAIVIVEDEAIVAADLAGKLRRLGYDVAERKRMEDAFMRQSCSIS